MNITGMKQRTRRRRRFNASLLIGVVLVFLVGLLAVKGHDWAPRDPLEITSIIRLGERYDVPPYSFGTPGFPLGSDQFGRDLLSQLLWAVRPTLIMVLIVAGVRLLLGIMIGLVTGWSDRWYSRVLDLAIAFGLAVPTLLVSLIVIARMGLRYGIWTFIVGLAVTGWSETAHYVRDQTRLLKKQVYIEAAQALGSSTASILRHHIFRQLRPLITLLAVIEMSATLMLVAELGFLGFFLGGGVFISIDDVTRRAGLGMPELGQMLAVGLNLTTEPFGLVVAGTVIFFTILGFNLIGEGLRQGLSLQHVRQRTFLDGVRETVNLWLDEKILYPMGNFHHSKWGQVLQAALLLLIIAFGIMRFSPLRGSSPASIAADETSLIPSFATRGSDATSAHGTSSPTAMQVASSAEILWQFPTRGVPIPPILSEDGKVYLVTHEDVLYSLDPDGSLRWQQQLIPAPHEIETFGQVRSVVLPQLSSDGKIVIVASDRIYALDEEGQRVWEAPLNAPPKQEDCCGWNPQKTEFYLVDDSAGLYALSAADGYLWNYTSGEGSLTPHSAPLVDSNGTVYFSASKLNTAYLFAVEDSGDLSWASVLPEVVNHDGFDIFRYDFGYSWLKIDPNEKFLFFNQDIIDASNGSVLKLDIDGLLSDIAHQLGLQERDPEPILRYFADQDGRIYLLTSDPIIAEVKIDGGNVQFPRTAAFQDYFIGLPGDRAGVAQNHYLWVEFERFPYAIGSSDEEGLGILWMDIESPAQRTLFLNVRGETLASRDERSASYYLCSAQRDPAQVHCHTESIHGGEAGWQVTVAGIGRFKYASLDLQQGRLYIFGLDNVLYGIDVSSP